MPESFFITGTDTGVGKTVVSALLCVGLDATYWKPVQTGTREGSDTETVLRLAQLPRARTLPESYRFKPAVSPHLAAQWAGVRIEVRMIKMRAPVQGGLVVEGAGGVFVPLNRTQLMIDLMRHLNLPVLLVARTSLGTINHTLLSLAALRAACLDTRAVIMVGEPNRENKAAIERYGKIQVAGTLPPLKKINRATLSAVFRNRFDRRVFRA